MTGIELAEKLISIDIDDGFSKRNPALTKGQVWNIYMGCARESLQKDIRPELIEQIAKDFPSILQNIK